jgi:aryl-alcohol dehydrogenase-like predicted oxidoreductase
VTLREISQEEGQRLLRIVRRTSGPVVTWRRAQVQMAIAFVTRHPAVTSAIVGPRTMEHLETYLAADDIDLSSDLLDRIDEIVPPGSTVNISDNMWTTSAMDAAFRRR